MSSLDYLDLCRLCLVKDRVSVPIFDGEGDVRQIFLKIAACLPVKVAREDKLPKKICDDCVYKVELFYQFWNTTVNAEKQLLQWLGEVGMEGKQGYVTNVLNPNVMKQEQSTENRLDGSVMQQVSEHQNNMGIGMMDNIGLGIPMIISNTNQQQQITSVPMDTSSNSAQNVQAVPGPSSQTTHNQISQNQTSSTQQEEEEESSEDEENSDDECDGDEGLPVKEESEEDPNSRTIEPTTFVNVSLACDEAGPSGLQQQKIADMPEIPMPQTADGDPKSGKPTIAETSTTHNPLQPLFIVCKGFPILDQDEVPVQIKDSPLSDEDETYSMQIDVDRSYDSSERMMEENNEVDINDDLYLDEAKYRSLPYEVSHHVSLSKKINSDSLSANVDNDFAADDVKEEPIMDTVPTVMVPIRDPVTREIRNTYVPVEVKDDTGLNIIKSVLIPVKDEDGLVSYEIKKVVVPINPERSLPTKKKKPLQIKLKPIKSKPEKKKTRVQRRQKRVKTVPVKSKDSKGKIGDKEANNLEEEFKIVPETGSPKDGRTKKLKVEDAQRKQKRVKPLTPVGSKDLEGKIEDKDEVDQLLETLRNTCPLCQKRFDNEKQMERHILRAHKNRYRCKSCQFSYASEDDLKKHMKTHEKDILMECPFCHLKYKRMCGLRAHQIREHSTVDPKSVRGPNPDQSNKDSISNYSLMNRSANQPATKRYICQFCDNAYPKKSYLVAHKRIVHEIQSVESKTFQCKVCSKKFVTEDNLRVHTNLHTQSFLCSHCGKKLANKYSLQLHIRTHTGERPYQCKVCSKTFTASVALRVHRLTHEGKRPYACDFCGQRFTQRSSMMAHRRKHPGNHPPPPPVFLGNFDDDSD
ncbi:uncharacterized protein LOC143345562 isoform X5 [Colletes latitarsis]|uniref:uncharacterized protein LOC143345562 isoform X5 n=1 Tax=Colletes latitarsis TaxID=2605962 RepID=UPI0040374410